MSRVESSLSSVSLASVASVAAMALGGTLIWFQQQRQQRQRLSEDRRTSKNAPPPPPPHAASWIPYVGAALRLGQRGLLDFVRSTARELGHRRHHHNKNHAAAHDESVVVSPPPPTTSGVPVFTATVLGEKCLFFADPADLMTVFRGKYQKYLDALSLQKHFVKDVLGADKVALEETFQPDVLKIGIQQYHHYLFKGPELERSMGAVLRFFMDWLPSVADDSWKTYGLYEFVSTAIFKASTGPLMSYAVAESDDALTNFFKFDKGTIPLFNGVPAFLMSSAIRGRDELLKLVRSEDYWDRASPLMMERKKNVPCSENSLDRANLGLLWASSGNSIPAVFWLVLRLLEDPPAWRACLSQVNEVIAKRNKKGSSDNGTSEPSNGFTLQELDELTLLESAFSESLRMYQGNVTARKVVKAFSFETASGQTYWIPEGTKLMAVWSVLHSDPHVHKQPEEFRYDRFVDKKKQYTCANGQVLTHDPIIPFGGGSHLCPGYVNRRFNGLAAAVHSFRIFTLLTSFHSCSLREY